VYIHTHTHEENNGTTATPDITVSAIACRGRASVWYYYAGVRENEDGEEDSSPLDSRAEAATRDRIIIIVHVTLSASTLLYIHG